MIFGAGHRSRSLHARARTAAAPSEAVTSSMTTIDRKLVRADALAARIEAAANSRSVRFV